ncbi:MAG TPA: LysM peptidoglycan-binding domain-containing protein [Sedimentisphaerales bacterium]|mgnify:CR=1 FL=1|nr:LysM peptidoglycan-binding domain-containing protein [Phycisphaerae bacterium]HON91304.1 LysM peptidoglycan-binding domain-containing protein [Sedimentisphaerales bacterium]HQG48188.1 LysM peptidoglycan-binding domain-containing protein [Sedimentisphaerales bacterium]HQI27191.1 LysM peptidoglycan-binding domain-containing protein [Sedimentisphaerales bacterium]
MGKDFRVGLITGVVLAGAALIWVATRPSLNLKARVPQTSLPSATNRQNAQSPLPWESVGYGETGQTQETVVQGASQMRNPATPAGDPSPTTPVPVAPASVSPMAASPNQTPLTGIDPVHADLTIYETSEPIKTTRFHIVRKGENLSSIARQYLGSADKWPQIVAANAKTIKDPNKIAPGTKLIIPN